MVSSLTPKPAPGFHVKPLLDLGCPGNQLFLSICHAHITGGSGKTRC